MSATLGGLIKDFRIKKGIKQIDIAFSLGWKETSRLSRIEQGKSAKPSRDLIENIMKAMQLSPIEKNQLLFAGNYLPTEQEITYIKGKFKSFINNWQYPACLLDFSWRALMQNETLLKTYNLPQSSIKAVNGNYPYILEIVFYLDLLYREKMRGENQKSWRQFLRNLIVQFRYYQNQRTQEKWYVDHIKSMMKKDSFKKLWLESQDMISQDFPVGKFVAKIIPHPENSDKLLKFYAFVVPFLEDPRFEVEMMVPSNLETYQFYHKDEKK